MKALKNYLHARRPIELVLSAVLAVLLVVSVWLAWALREQVSDDVEQLDVVTTEVRGTAQEINAITEEELVDSQLLDKDIENLSEKDLYESAADNYGGIYDESAY